MRNGAVVLAMFAVLQTAAGAQVLESVSFEDAIQREKNLKHWVRGWKMALIEAVNPDWRDLAEDLGFEPLQS